MDEEDVVYAPREPIYEPISVCKCLIDQDSSEQIVISERKKYILTTVSRTEAYLKERRIPELVRFILSKLLVSMSTKPVLFLDDLVNKCMLFRAGFGTAPVLFEDQHIEAIVKSFDPGQRGWLTAGQVRRAFITIGCQPPEHLNDRIPCEEVLDAMKKTQESDLLDLLMAGVETQESTEVSNSDSSDT